jgi:hypothetical protein
MVTNEGGIMRVLILLLLVVLPTVGSAEEPPPVLAKIDPLLQPPPKMETDLHFTPDHRPATEKISPLLRQRAARMGPGSSAKVLVTLVQPSFLAKAAPWSSEHDAVRARHIAALEHEFVSRSAEFDFRPSSALKHSPVVCGSIAVDRIDALASLPMVRAVEYDIELKATRVQGGNLIMAPQLRSQGGRGNGVGVAVLDTGIDWNHVEMNGKVAARGDYTDTQPNEDDWGMDDNGHGTSCAGIIAGLSGGMAPQAHLWAIKVLDSEGDGDLSNTATALDELYDARTEYGGLHVVNMSLGGSAPINYECDTDMPSMTSAMANLIGAGIPIFVSSGNDGCTNGIGFPACVSHAISVGAVYDANIGSALFEDEANCNASGCEDTTTAADQVTCYSNSGTYLDILAPSHCAATPGLGGGMESCFGGTSASAPYAAGSAAQILSLLPNATPAQIRNAFKSTGKPVTDPWNGLTRSRIDGLAAYQFLAGGGGSCVNSNTTMCLRSGDRFEITVDWHPANDPQFRSAFVSSIRTSDSGIFYYNNPENLEFLIKVLNGCPVNNHYWVFFAATTNVAFNVTVTDTETGASKLYQNLQGNPADAITDTEAFATCP